MAQMKMSAKISVGFVLMIVLLLVVGGVAILFLSTTYNGFVQYREWARDSNLMANLQENMLMVRMNVKDFVIRGDQKEKEEFDQYYNRTAEIMDEAQEEIQAADRAPIVDQIDEALAGYGTRFDQVVDLQGQRDELVTGTMDVIGPRLEQDLTKILRSARNDGDMAAAYNASLALRNLMLARLYAFKFLDSNTEEDEQRTLSEVAAMEENLATLDRELQNAERRALLEQIMEYQNEYVDAFKQVVGIIYERNDNINNYLDVVGPEIAEQGMEVMQSIQADQDRLGPQLQRSNQMARTIVIIVAAAAILLGIVLTVFIVRSILRQLGEDPSVIQDIAGRIALGDLDINIDGENVRGVYLSVKEMVDALKYKADRIEQVANKDLTIDIRKASEKDQLGESLIIMKNSLNELLAQVNEAVDQVSSGADQVSQASQNLSQGATEQASSLEEISSSMTEVNSQSKQNAENATEANALAKKAAEDARNGNEQMERLNRSMENINNSSEEINKVVKVIDDIAFQINLLALNANVEAARAGKYGKGFAVVAEEVRNLAVRSADAVKETTAMVEDSVRNITEGTEAATSTAEALAEIVDGVGKVAEFLGEIAMASKEQADAIEQITNGIDQIDQVTQSNTASAEESASASEELASQSQQLQAMIAQFKIEGVDSGKSRKRLLTDNRGAGGNSGNGGNGGGGQAEVSLNAGKKSPVLTAAPSASQQARSNASEDGWSSDNTGIAPVDPAEVINLDDDDFDNF